MSASEDAVECDQHELRDAACLSDDEQGQLHTHSRWQRSTMTGALQVPQLVQLFRDRPAALQNRHYLAITRPGGDLSRVRGTTGG